VGSIARAHELAFWCCACAKADGWSGYNESGCDQCKSFVQDFKDSAKWVQATSAAYKGQSLPPKSQALVQLYKTAEVDEAVRQLRQEAQATAKLDKVAEKQRQREAEIEAKQRLQDNNVWAGARWGSGFGDRDGQRSLSGGGFGEPRRVWDGGSRSPEEDWRRDADTTRTYGCGGGDGAGRYVPPGARLGSGFGDRDGLRSGGGFGERFSGGGGGGGAGRYVPPGARLGSGFGDRDGLRSGGGFGERFAARDGGCSPEEDWRRRDPEIVTTRTSGGGGGDGAGHYVPPDAPELAGLFNLPNEVPH